MTESQELQIIEYRPTAAALAELSGKFKGVVYQVDSTKGMAEAKTARAEIRSYRVDLEKMRNTLKADILEKGRLIDGEAKRIRTALEELEDPIDAQIKAEECRKEAECKAKEEADRAAQEEIQMRIAEIQNWPSRFIGCQSTAISAELENLDAFDGGEFGLYAAIAREAHAFRMAILDAMLGKAIAHEQEQERIEADRAELARAQAEERAKVEADRAELAMLRAEQRAKFEAEQSEQTERLKAEREAEAGRMRLEREKHEAELTAQRQEAARVEAENRKAKEESEARAQAAREAERTRLAELAKEERSAYLMQRLTEIANVDMPVFTKLLKAYQMGREDLAIELSKNNK